MTATITYAKPAAILNCGKPPKSVNHRGESRGATIAAKKAAQAAIKEAVERWRATGAELPEQQPGERFVVVPVWASKQPPTDRPNAYRTIKPYVDCCRQTVKRKGPDGMEDVPGLAPILVDDSDVLLRRDDPIRVTSGKLPALLLEFYREEDLGDARPEAELRAEVIEFLATGLDKKTTAPSIAKELVERGAITVDLAAGDSDEVQHEKRVMALRRFCLLIDPVKPKRLPKCRREPGLFDAGVPHPLDTVYLEELGVIRPHLVVGRHEGEAVELALVPLDEKFSPIRPKAPAAVVVEERELATGTAPILWTNMDPQAAETLRSTWQRWCDQGCLLQIDEETVKEEARAFKLEVDRLAGEKKEAQKAYDKRVEILLGLRDGAPKWAWPEE